MNISKLTEDEIQELENEYGMQKVHGHTWSDEQTAVFRWYAEGTGNLVIEALAGTGKTTTIKEAFTYVHPDVNSILYAVFNKRNQKEAEAKISDSRVEVRTLHSLGFSFIKNVWPTAKPDDTVEIDRVVSYLGNYDKELVGLTCKLVGLAKNSFISPTEADLYTLADKYDIDFATTERTGSAMQTAMKVLADSKLKDPAGRISFNDMVWLPCANNWVKPKYDVVTIDEAQDMNLPQLTMARQSCKPTGRIVVVGDSRQAIYGFRGAVQNGMGMMKMILKAQVLSLTTTYRCPKLVVEQAAKYVSAYKAADEAPEGKVSSVNQADLMATVAVGDAILSRLNAPLMPLALSFLRKGISARIEGRDIGKQLVGMIKSLKAVSVEDLIIRVHAWEIKQTARLRDSKNAEKKIEQVHDMADTIEAICADCESIADAERKLSSLFQDTDEKSKPAVVLSSVHKAKGLEWKRVFLLSETFRASKGSEEENIYYVALTRAMSELYFVGSGAANQTVLPAEQPKALPEAKKPAISEPETVTVSVSAKSLLPPAKFDSGKVHAATTLFDSTGLLPGMRRRVVGEVIELVNSKKINVAWMVTNVTDSSATIQALNNRSAIDHISSTCDAIDKPVMADNFQLPKSGVEGTNQKNSDAKNNSMSKQDQTIEILISKAISMGKDDNKITIMCLSNYPNVPATEVVKLIDKGRKAAGRPVKATPPPKAAKVLAKSSPTTGARPGKCAFADDQLLSGKFTKSQIVSQFLKKFGGEEKTARNTVNWCVTTMRKRHNRVSRHIEEGRTNAKIIKNEKVKATPPAKKAAKPAAKATPPPKAAVVPAASDIPAQGEEVPQS